MKINYGLIMSAGLGTRMGLIGESLPKVIWPVYETTLLKLQVNRLKGLGCEKIIINSHFLHEEIKNYIDKNLSNEVDIFYEPILYGSGGTINELKAQGKISNSGTLLYSAGDQFLFFNDEAFFTSLSIIKNNNTVLFGLTVDKDSGYGELKLNSQKKLEHIIPSKNKSEDFITYSGLGLINLEKIEGKRGYSEFFNSVAHLGKDNMVLTPKEQEYWDFGTAEKFIASSKRLMDELSDDKIVSEFKKFFLNNVSIKNYAIEDKIQSHLSNEKLFEVTLAGDLKGFKYGDLSYRL